MDTRTAAVLATLPADVGLTTIPGPLGNRYEVAFPLAAREPDPRRMLAQLAQTAHKTGFALLRSDRSGESFTVGLQPRSCTADVSLGAAIDELFALQLRAFRVDDHGDRHGFFAIVEEDGDTLDYAFVADERDGGELARGVCDPRRALRAAALAIQNSARARRPAATGQGLAAPDPEPGQSVLSPHRIDTDSNFAHELILLWPAPSGRVWRLMCNPFPIFPERRGAPTAEQPHQLTISADTLIHQREAIAPQYVADLVECFAALAPGPDRADACAFRVGVNGWSYAPGGPKAGASQAQLHWNAMRVAFPLEAAALRTIAGARGAGIHVTEDDRFGSVICVEGERSERAKLAAQLAWLLNTITRAGNSFNVLLAPGPSGVRAFVAERPRGTPHPLFANEFAYCEVGRAIVIDDPRAFYELDAAQRRVLDDTPSEALARWISGQKRDGRLPRTRGDLGERIAAALRMVTSPPHRAFELATGLAHEFNS